MFSAKSTLSGVFLFLVLTTVTGQGNGIPELDATNYGSTTPTFQNTTVLNSTFTQDSTSTQNKTRNDENAKEVSTVPWTSLDSSLEQPETKTAITAGFSRPEASTGKTSYPWRGFTVALSFQNSTGQHSEDPAPLTTTVAGSSSESNSGDAGLIFNRTFPPQICARNPDKRVKVFCYCDEFCDVFNDCCPPLHTCPESSQAEEDHGKRRARVGLGRNNIACKSQSTIRLRGVVSHNFWMISACPNEWGNDSVRDKCENSTNRNAIDRLLPVSDPVTKLAFQNQYCAECHFSTNSIKWTSYVTCFWPGTVEGLSITSVTDVMDLLKSRPSCGLRFEPPADLPGRPCAPNGNPPARFLSWQTGRHCGPNADPRLKELCSTGPMLITRVRQEWRPSTYMRNVFCWLCEKDSVMPADIDCPEEIPDGARGFSPVGLTMLLDPSAEHSKACKAVRKASCDDDDDDDDESQCQSVISSLFNVEFPFQVAVIANAALKASAYRGVCAAVYIHANSVFVTDPPLYTLAHTPWHFSRGNGMNCTEMAETQNGQNTTHSVVAIWSMGIHLREDIQQYSEGLKRLESFKEEVNRELLARDEKVTYGGKTYQLRVLLNEGLHCAGVTTRNGSKIMTPTATNPGDVPRSRGEVAFAPPTHAFLFVAFWFQHYHEH